MEKIFGIVPIKLAPGMTGEFRTRGLACIAAASKDLTGTSAYEWFVSPDGSEALVIEIYDDTEAVAIHGRMVGSTVMSMVERAKFEILSAGVVGLNAGTMIFAVARFAIQPGKQDEFRALAREAFARVESE